jgi:hypothetical protein
MGSSHYISIRVLLDDFANEANAVALYANPREVTNKLFD